MERNVGADSPSRARIEFAQTIDHIPISGPEHVLENLFSDKPESVISAMKFLVLTLKSVIDGESDLISLQPSLFQILERLLVLSMAVEEDVKTLSERTLSLFLSLDPMKAFGRSEPQLFMILLTDGPAHLKLGLMVIERVLNIDPEFKNAFLKTSGLTILRSTPIEHLPVDLREIFASIIAICMREDFPGWRMPDEIAEELLCKVMGLIECCGNDCLLEIARSCYYFVQMSDRLEIFMRNGLHMVLRDAFPRMGVEGRTFTLSTFGVCFLCDEWAETMLADIPLGLFAEHLNCEDDSARIDTAGALRNVFNAKLAMARAVFESGLMNVIVAHIRDDIFMVRKELIKAVSMLILGSNPNALGMFLIPELFEGLDSAFQTRDKKIVEILLTVASVLHDVEIADGRIAECLMEWEESEFDI